MPSIQYGSVKEPNHDNAVAAKIFKFIQKLTKDDASLGLHVEPIAHSVDPRARTARVDNFWRAVLYRTDWPGGEVVYVYAGTWPHDVAIERARTRALRRNPIHGVLEFVNLDPTSEFGAGETVHSKAGQGAKPSDSYLATHGYFVSELVDALGIEEDSARQLFEFTEVEQIEQYSETRENAWEQVAILGLALGDTIEQIRSELQLDRLDQADADLQDDERLARAFEHPATRMQFTFIDNDEDLRRVIEGKDFEAWRVFLHPEQLKYAETDRNASFRLSGGAGTGKTVVLLHRTRHLAKLNPAARIVFTTFTKALSGALDRSLNHLDPNIERAQSLGESGVLIRGIDQIAASVRDRFTTAFWSASAELFTGSLHQRHEVVASDVGWKESIESAGKDLPAELRSVSFLESEYSHVILPSGAKTREEYFVTARPGRRIALDRRKRAAVWAVVDRYREAAEQARRLSYAEIAAIAAATLNRLDPEHRVADHVLVDEAQDLSPVHWQLLRALVPEGRNDLFISEDSHQRIYGKPVVASRYGISIRGRSRRMTLNYRTTHEVLDFAMSALEGSTYVNSEDELDSTSGYRSSRTGPKPRLIACADDDAQFDAVASAIKSWLDDDVAPASIAILVRTNKQRDLARSQLASRGVVVQAVDSGEGAGKLPVAMTMHLAKGQEFSRVVMFDLSAGSVPPAWVLSGVSIEDRDAVLAQERSLIYVAASRARDEVMVTWAGEPSSLLGVV